MSKHVEIDNMTLKDAQGRVLRKPRDNSSGEAIHFRWWTLDEKDMAESIASTVRFLDRNQSSRMRQLLACTRLYGLSSAQSLIGTAFSKARSVEPTQSSRMSFNLCQSIVDTLESKMAKNKIVPTYVTNGGDYSAQKKAKQLTKFTQGLFYKYRVHKKTIEAWKDAAIWGDGFIQIYEKHDEICLERAFSHELFVDTVETLASPPQQLHKVKYIERDIALSLFPELEDSIKTVQPAEFQDVGGSMTAVDMISIIESWHLQSGPKSKDGVHVISVGDQALVENYEKDYFPFAHIRYARRPFGWYGQGAVERLERIQEELNRIMALQQRSFHMQGSFKVLIENGSKVVTQHLNNEVGSIIHYTGTPPSYVTPPATSSDIPRYIQELIQWAYTQEGVSQMTATGSAPMGIESGKALRTLTQISDDRFLYMGQEMEGFTLEVARQCVEVAKQIYDRKGKFEVVFPDTRFPETVDWGDIKLDQEEYVLKAFPTSSLSDDLTGRLAEIQELAQAGMITPRAARRLLDMPDLEASDALANAGEDRIHQIYEKMLDDKEYISYEANFIDATLATQIGLEYINFGQLRNCPEENLQLVRDYLGEIQAYLNQAQAAQMAMQAQALPQAAPQAPAQSNLIPNVPRGTME